MIPMGKKRCRSLVLGRRREFNRNGSVSGLAIAANSRRGQFTMKLECPSCHHILEFSAEPPSFCAYCGQAVGKAKTGNTVDYDPDAATLPPSESSAGTRGSIPEVVGGYRLLRPLGAGGMGTVYEAEEASSGRHVAVKLIAPEFATSKDAVDRFRQEGRLASTIVHPRCVFVLAADEQAGQPYIAMELMPGATLQDLVKERGPLPVAEVIAKILDVIDGLQEVHRLGVIHRDIKPSNCFLEADGRVKIGDFGLCKSLIGDAHLTKTGSFLGTPLYASPEQIKRERVDQQSDVYAVAATLYFLLTGRAPHQTGDAAATIARIVSDPVPSMRSVQQGIPPALDRVVLRALERDRKHRWKSLEEFRASLSLFIQSELSIGGIGIRAGAYVGDVLLFVLTRYIVGMFLIFMGTPVALSGFTFGGGETLSLSLILALAENILWIAYFTLLEGVWGCSLGKRWLRLRVCSSESGALLGMPRAFLRTLIFYMLVSLGQPIAAILTFTYLPRTRLPSVPTPDYSRLVIGILPWLWLIVGLAVAGCTMRKRNGYRALQDLLSGSRVVQLSWPVRGRKWREPAQEHKSARTEGLPERIGAFDIKGSIRWTPDEAMLLAEDAILNRKVWLWLRPQSAPPLSQARRDIARSARLRWLASGHAGERRWDAFVAPPAGWSLPGIITQQKRLSWVEARPLLEQLTEEMVATNRDGTIPDVLTPSQIWVQPDGGIVLLDVPTEGFPAEVRNGVEPEIHRGAMGLLRAVAVWMLEGQPRLGTGRPESIRTPAPKHAAHMLDRLVGVTEPYARVEEFHSNLADTHDRPTQVTRRLRTGHLVVQAVLLPIVFLLWALVAHFLSGLLIFGTEIRRPSPERLAILSATVSVSMLCVAGAFLCRGGWTLPMMGIVLVDGDGRIASRLRCAWRAFLVWLPVIALHSLLTSSLVDNDLALGGIMLGGTTLIMILYFFLTLVSPRRGLHDELAGTYLVPK
jgi:hypothetical protein